MRFALLLLAAPAFAQDRPPAIFPARDVAVEYRLQSDGQTHNMRMSWLSARNLVRIDMPQGFGVFDQRAGTGFMAMERERIVMDINANATPGGALMRVPENARFTREAQDRVAGQACTTWRVESQGQSSRSCITPDGVMLRTVTGNTTIEAQRVEYAAQDAARFNRPAGFQSFQMPAGIAPPGGTFPQRGTALPPPGLR